MSGDGLEERIGTLLAQHRPELEQLVDQAFERELAQLVEQRLAARNGGNRADLSTSPESMPAAETTTRVCEGCGETKPAAAFEKYRRSCRECRRRDRRNTPQPTPVEPERPAAIDPDELRERARVEGPAADDLTAWLVSEGYAEQTPAGLVPTGRGVKLGAGIN